MKRRYVIGTSGNDFTDCKGKQSDYGPAYCQPAPRDAGSFALYTNSTKLGVTIVSDAEQSGTVTLVDAATGDGIRYAAVSGRSAVCEFTALTAAQRYRVSCEGFSPDTVVTISDARTVSFWHSLRAVLGELLSLLAGG